MERIDGLRMCDGKTSLRKPGHIWQGRFQSPAIETNEHLRTVLHYVESNPVRAGVVDDWAAYPWSS
jgi:putative transposase